MPHASLWPGVTAPLMSDHPRTRRGVPVRMTMLRRASLPVQHLMGRHPGLVRALFVALMGDAIMGVHIGDERRRHHASGEARASWTSDRFRRIAH